VTDPRAREIHVVGAAILRDGLCLAAQRGPAMRLAGQWEFPGGKVEPGEDPCAALAREVREELGLDIHVASLLGSGRAPAGPSVVILDVYLATLLGGDLRLLEHSAVRWISAGQLDDLDWAAADRPLLPLLHPLLHGRPGL
jgi:8-oxo-dGTP diphosphatase